MAWLHCCGCTARLQWYGCTAMAALLWLHCYGCNTISLVPSLLILLSPSYFISFLSSLPLHLPLIILTLPQSAIFSYPLPSPSLSLPPLSLPSFFLSSLTPLSLSPFQNITDIEGYFKQELNISSVTTHIFPTRLPLEGLEALWVSKRGTSFPVVIRLFNLKHLALNFTSHYSVRRRTVCTLVAAVYCSRVTACMCSRNDCM